MALVDKKSRTAIHEYNKAFQILQDETIAVVSFLLSFITCFYYSQLGNID